MAERSRASLLMDRSRRMELYIEVQSMKELNGFLREIKEKNLEVRDVLMEPSVGFAGDGLAAIVVIRWRQKICYKEIISELQEVSGVGYLEEI